jgi:site-specific recombinase XerD
MGLRLSEALSLQVADIDKNRMKVHIRCGKGKKDRLVTLPQMTLLALRRYWATHRHPSLLFPAGQTHEARREAAATLGHGGVQKALKAIAKECGIKKHVTPHTLRHSYGALSVEAGVSLRVIQHEMGHAGPNTTALYTQLTDSTFEESSKLLNAMLSPLNLSWGK